MKRRGSKCLSIDCRADRLVTALRFALIVISALYSQSVSAGLPPPPSHPAVFEKVLLPVFIDPIVGAAGIEWWITLRVAWMRARNRPGICRLDASAGTGLSEHESEKRILPHSEQELCKNKILERTVSGICFSGSSGDRCRNFRLRFYNDFTAKTGHELPVVRERDLTNTTFSSPGCRFTSRHARYAADLRLRFSAKRAGSGAVLRRMQRDLHANRRNHRFTGKQCCVAAISAHSASRWLRQLPCGSKFFPFPGTAGCGRSRP